jgi:hypothetical protein
VRWDLFVLFVSVVVRLGLLLELRLLKVTFSRLFSMWRLLDNSKTK